VLRGTLKPAFLAAARGKGRCDRRGEANSSYLSYKEKLLFIGSLAQRRIVFQKMR